MYIHTHTHVYGTWKIDYSLSESTRLMNVSVADTTVTGVSPVYREDLRAASFLHLLVTQVQLSQETMWCSC